MSLGRAAGCVWKQCSSRWRRPKHDSSALPWRGRASGQRSKSARRCAPKGRSAQSEPVARATVALSGKSWRSSARSILARASPLKRTSSPSQESAVGCSTPSASREDRIGSAPTSGSKRPRAGEARMVRGRSRSTDTSRRQRRRRACRTSWKPALPSGGPPRR